MRKLLARLVDAEVRQLRIELAHVRCTRRQAVRAATDQHVENTRLRARVAELEQLLLNPNTLKGPHE
ncbi:hypothetical protein ABZX66_28235 [Micromonospora aurantiaca]|uniref:hypothetical protein n=1 Tax=Micromonospora aurantiaca (nom. illeg.) TaxID=47850 RepID=UPI0033B671B9